MDLSWHNTDQVWLLSRLTYFFSSYCPLHKFSFPNFSLLSFVILTWNLVYEFVLTWYRSSFIFVAFDLLLQELLPFAKILFSRLFFVIFGHIHLKFHIGKIICLDIIQVNFDSGQIWPTFTGVIALCKNLFFQTFLSCLVILTLHLVYELVLT